MASLTTNALCIPTMVAAAAAPRCRRSLIVARASPAKHDERQDPAVKVDAAGGRRRAMVLFSAAAITASTAAAVRSARAGGVSTKSGPGQWVDIENVADPYVQDLGKWAVMEHNSQTGGDLQFGKVVGGKQQVVAGMNYKLEIETKGGPSRFYEAGLFVSLPPEKRTLNSFEPSA